MLSTILMLLFLAAPTHSDCLTCKADFGHVSVGNRMAKSPDDLVNSGHTPSALAVTYTRGTSAGDGRKLSPNMVTR